MHQFRLLYNAAAHFAAEEKFPDGLIPAITAPGTEGFRAVCWVLSELSMQAELYRRYMGYDPAEPISEAKALAILRPLDVIPARAAILDAVSRGMRNGEEGEVDEVLLEIQKKKGAG